MRTAINFAAAMKCGALLCFAGYAVHASPILYTFTATTQASLGSPGHTQTFQMIAPDFLPVDGGNLISFLASRA